MQRTSHAFTDTYQPRDDIYGHYNHAHFGNQHGSNSVSGPVTHTQSPVVTGTSVIGIKYNEGVVIAADNLGE